MVRPLPFIEVISFSPPLCMTEADCDEAVELFGAPSRPRPRSSTGSPRPDAALRKGSRERRIPSRLRSRRTDVGWRPVGCPPDNERRDR